MFLTYIKAQEVFCWSFKLSITFMDTLKACGISIGFPSNLVEVEAASNKIVKDFVQ